MVYYNYLLVDSPFQLLCGIEYILKHNLKAVKLIIVNNKVYNKKHIDQINRIFSLFEFLFIDKKIYQIDTSKYLIFYYFLAKYQELIRDINNSGKVNHLIIGDYGNCYFRHVANLIDNNKTIILDDGFGTIKTVANIKSNSLELKEYIKSFLSLYTYKPAYSTEVTLFTIFFEYVDMLNVEINDFKSLKCNLNKVKIGNELHFIGSPLVEDKIVDITTYRAYLKKICEKYSKKYKIFYIPHRREDMIRVRNLTAELAIEVMEVDKTIEFYEVSRSVLPSIIISFFSTALFNLSRMLPKEVNIRYLKLKDEMILSRQSHIKNIYKILDKEINEEIIGNV